MRLNPGFVLAGRYEIAGVVRADEATRTYRAVSSAQGPGSVEVVVARHDESGDLHAIQRGRDTVARRHRRLERLARAAPGLVPTPIGLIRSYPGDRSVRRALLPDVDRVRDEPYSIRCVAAGRSLASMVNDAPLDEDVVLDIVARLAELEGHVREAGLTLAALVPPDLTWQPGIKNLSLVDVGNVASLDSSARGWDARWLAELMLSLLDGGRGRALHSERHVLDIGPALRDLGASDATTQIVRACLSADPIEPSALARRAAAAAGRPMSRPGGGAASPPALVREHGAALVAAFSADDVGSDEIELLGGRFALGKELASGGRGEVYTAVDVASGVVFVVKRNRYVFDSADEFLAALSTRRRELAHEFEMLRRFHPLTGATPPPASMIYDRGRGGWFDLVPHAAEQEPHIVMALAPGRTLTALLSEPRSAGRTSERSGLPAAFVADLVARLAALLARIHAEGFLHQDVKPENVLWDPVGDKVTLVDLASLCPRTPDGLLDESSVAFGFQTPGYAGPEFSERAVSLDERFDIYSLGATAWHLLTARNPQRLALERDDDYPELALAALPEATPRHLRDLVGAMLERRPGDRPGTMEEVADAAASIAAALGDAPLAPVRNLSATPDAGGTSLTWRWPSDARVSGAVLEERTATGEWQSLGTATRGDAGIFTVPHARGESRRILVHACSADRRGQGRSVVLEAFPPPRIRSLRPRFGGAALEIAQTGLSDELRVVWKPAHPATGPTDGEVVVLRSDGTAEIRSPAEKVIFVSAYARYGDNWSAPEAASVRALPSLPTPGELVWRQDESGVHLMWSTASALLRIERTSDDTPTRVWTLSHDQREVFDGGLAPSQTATYHLYAQVDEIRSDVLASVDVTRWPPAPRIEIVEGPARLSVHVAGLDATLGRAEATISQEGDIRFRRDLWVGDGDHGVPQDARLVVEAIPDVPAIVRIETTLGDRTGPSVCATAVAPPPSVALTLRVEGVDEQISVRVSLPPNARRWTGTFALALLRGGQVVEDRSLTPVDSTAPVSFVLRDGNPPIGQQLDYDVELAAPDSSTLATESFQATAVRTLPPPRVEGALDAVVVLADDGDEAPRRCELSWSFPDRGEDKSEKRDAELPYRIDVVRDEEVVVRRRIASSTVEMPWSEPTRCRGLVRPDPPKAVRATLRSSARGSGVAVEWTSDCGRVAVVERVRGGNEAPVYRGAAGRALDLGGAEGDRYRVRLISDDLMSDPRESGPVPPAANVQRSARSGSARTPSGTMSERQPAPERAGLTAARALRLDSSHDVAELWACRGRETLVCAAVIGDATPDGANGVCRELDALGSRWWKSDAVIGQIAVVRPRCLFVWRRSEGCVALLARPLSSPSAPWRAVGVAPVRADAELIYAEQAGADVLRLRGRRSWSQTLQKHRLAGLRAADGQAQIAWELPLTEATVERAAMFAWHRRADVATITIHERSRRSDGLTLAPLDRPTVLVAGELGAPRDRSLLWRDAAHGLLHLLLDRVEASNVGTAISKQVGMGATLNILVRGEPLTLVLDIISPDAHSRGDIVLGGTASRPEAPRRIPYRLAEVAWLHEHTIPALIDAIATRPQTGRDQRAHGGEPPTR